MKKILALVVLVAVVLGSGSAPVAAVDREAPSRERWLKDVHQAMKGSGAYLRARAASGETGLAINFDIDNSSIATYYDGGNAGAIPRIRKLARVADRLGIDLVFNTGRSSAQRRRTVAQLAAAGYDVAVLCMRKQGEALPHGKQRCRDRFIAKGYTLIANVGHRPTDFAGDGYEMAYRLPNYRGLLG
jgi:hypothetical protein